ncbi:hypothetical protein SHIRM173S_06110 [Streptomyces hirsutus]
MAELVQRLILEDHLPLFWGGPLGHHDDRRVVDLEPALHLLTDLIDVKGPLRDEDHVAAARDAGVQRDPPGVPPHDLHHQGAHVRLGGGVEAVDGLGRDADCGVEAEGVVGAGDVVVDGLRHADQGDSLTAQFGGYAERVLAADHDERIHVVRGKGVLYPSQPVLVCERVGAGGAENGSAAGEDPPHARDVQWPDIVLEQAQPAVPQADEVEGVFVDAFADDTADDGVEAGAVTAAGQYSDLHGFSPIRWTARAVAADDQNRCREHGSPASSLPPFGPQWPLDGRRVRTARS